MLPQVLESGTELLVEAGFLYLPLLFDPSVAEEIAPVGGLNNAAAVVEVDGRYFVKALSLNTLVENHENILADAFEQWRRAWRQEHGLTPIPNVLFLDDKLRAIIFEIIPYFLKKTNALGRSRLSPGEILDWLQGKLAVPASYYEQADNFLTRIAPRGKPERLTAPSPDPEPLKDGLVSASTLRHWFFQAVESNLAARERARQQELIRQQEHFAQMPQAHLAILLFLIEQGRLEVDGVGFARLSYPDEYVIYKRTGEYVLKDYYNRLYLFPDCRVAVSTLGSLKPLVLERYKHPFLFGYASEQEICLRESGPPRRFTAQNAIEVLEEGLNALYYGYDSRRRNGYHSLDRVTQRYRAVDFDDYRIPRDHPKIVSGQVEIKNFFK